MGRAGGGPSGTSVQSSVGFSYGLACAQQRWSPAFTAAPPPPDSNSAAFNTKVTKGQRRRLLSPDDSITADSFSALSSGIHSILTACRLCFSHKALTDDA